MREEVTRRMLYKFEELTDKGKEKALENLYDINVDGEWWEYFYEDADRIGLKIEGFDLDRGSRVEGHFIDRAVDTARRILEEHGKDCETYKTATSYLQERTNLIDDWRRGNPEAEEGEEEDIDFEDIDHDFLKSLLEDYLSTLREEYEYQTSEEAIRETIEANEYEFTEDGKLA